MSFMQPIVIRNEDTLKTLADDMKLCMSEDPITSADLPDGYKYSATPEEALINSAEVQAEVRKRGKSMWEQGGHRIILFHGHLITLALSLDEFDETPPFWHLSMGLVMINSEPNRVPDKFANVIAKVFFGTYNEQNPPKQGFSKIRHFFSPAPKKEAVDVPNYKTAESSAAN